MIPSELFRPTDLKEPVTLERRFDLAMSLEVAEHLPESCAEPFVESLTKLSDVVLFSAAIPLQGGDEHIHERWHDYWVELFEARGYRPIDALRPQLWNNPDVDIWYVQNLLLFANDAGLAAQPKLAEPLAQTRREQLSMVHPEALVILARNYAKKTVSFSKLARWRLAGLNDENYRRDRKINRTMRYQRTLPLPTDPPSEP